MELWSFISFDLRHLNSLKMPKNAKFGYSFFSAENWKKTKIQNSTKISIINSNFITLNVTWSSHKYLFVFLLGLLATYSGAGSIQDLREERKVTKSILRELKEGLWIKRGTRYVSVDFTLYNANINYFCVIT